MARRSTLDEPNIETGPQGSCAVAPGALRHNVSLQGDGAFSSTDDGVKIRKTTTYSSTARCTKCKREQSVTAEDTGRKGHGPARLINEALRALGWRVAKTGRTTCPQCIEAEPAPKAKPRTKPKTLADAKRAAKLKAEGKSLREIGEELGVSRQRVHQLLNG